MLKKKSNWEKSDASTGWCLATELFHPRNPSVAGFLLLAPNALHCHFAVTALAELSFLHRIHSAWQFSIISCVIVTALRSASRSWCTPAFLSIYWSESYTVNMNILASLGYATLCVHSHTSGTNISTHFKSCDQQVKLFCWNNSWSLVLPSLKWEYFFQIGAINCYFLW